MKMVKGLYYAGRITSDRYLINKFIKEVLRVSNKAKCLQCEDIIESVHVHDWVCCKCWKSSEGKTGIFIDGGDEYCRYGGDVDKMEWIED